MPNMMTDDERETWLGLLAAGRKKAAKLLKEAGLAQPYAPGGETVLVLRLPPPPTVKVTAAGIHIPEKSQEEEEPKSEGYLIDGGSQAMNVFLDQGYLPGDLVQIGRFAGWEKAFGKESKGEKKILQMQSGDVLGSFDLLGRLEGPKPSMERILDPMTEEFVVRVT